MDFMLEFPDQVVLHGRAAYNLNGIDLRCRGDRGSFGIERAFGNGLGLSVKTSKGEVIKHPERPHFALLWDAFATAIAERKPFKCPGEMGRRDVKIAMAIYESARTGRVVPVTADS